MFKVYGFRQITLLGILAVNAAHALETTANSGNVRLVPESIATDTKFALVNGTLQKVLDCGKESKTYNPDSDSCTTGTASAVTSTTVMGPYYSGWGTITSTTNLGTHTFCTVSRNYFLAADGGGGIYSGTGSGFGCAVQGTPNTNWNGITEKGAQGGVQCTFTCFDM